MDEDLRNPPNRPPPLMGPGFRFDSEDDGMRRDKMMGGSMRGDMDFRNQFGNFRNDFQGRDGDSRNNFHARNNFNTRDLDFRDFDDRNRDQFHGNDMDFRGRDFDQRHCDYDDRENFDMRGSKEGNFENYDDRSNFNSSNNSFNQNGRWDDGPPQDNNWGSRPPPLMSGPNWDKDDADFRNFNRNFNSGQSNNNFNARKIRGGARNHGGPRARSRRGRGRFPKN